jgi:hypothetical protein
MAPAGSQQGRSEDMNAVASDAGAAGHEVLGLPYEVAQGLSLLLFVLAALLLLLVVAALMKRRAAGERALPGAGIVLLAIGLASLLFALLLKLL